MAHIVDANRRQLNPPRVEQALAPGALQQRRRRREPGRPVEESGIGVGKIAQLAPLYDQHGIGPRGPSAALKALELRAPRKLVGVFQPGSIDKTRRTPAPRGVGRRLDGTDLRIVKHPQLPQARADPAANTFERPDQIGLGGTAPQGRTGLPHARDMPLRSDEAPVFTADGFKQSAHGAHPLRLASMAIR